MPGNVGGDLTRGGAPDARAVIQIEVNDDRTDVQNFGVRADSNLLKLPPRVVYGP